MAEYQDGDYTPNVPLEKTYIYREGKRWLVSTINRQSSAVLAYGRRYAETIVFEITGDGPDDLRIVTQTEAPEGSYYGHDMMVQRLRQTGSPDDPEEPTHD